MKSKSKSRGRGRPRNTSSTILRTVGRPRKAKKTSSSSSDHVPLSDVEDDEVEKVLMSPLTYEKEAKKSVTKSEEDLSLSNKFGDSSQLGEVISSCEGNMTTPNKIINPQRGELIRTQRQKELDVTQNHYNTRN